MASVKRRLPREAQALRKTKRGLDGHPTDDEDWFPPIFPNGLIVGAGDEDEDGNGGPQMDPYVRPGNPGTGFQWLTGRQPVVPDDGLPPSAPTELTVVAELYNAVMLEWETNTEIDMIGSYGRYKVEVSEDEDFTLPLHATHGPMAATLAAIEGLEGDVEYWFRVIAVDANDEESAPSNVVSATPLDLSMDPAGIEGVDTLPILPNSGYPIGKHVFLSTDGKLYRNVADAWTAAVAAVDLTGQITTTQIEDDAITTPKLVTAAVTADAIAANAVTTAALIADAVTAGKIAANAVDAAQIAADAIRTIHIKALQIEAGHIKANEITAAKIAAFTMESGKWIKSSNYDGTNFTTGDATTGWNIEATGGAEFQNVRARGRFETAASGQRVVLDSDSADFYSSSGHTPAAAIEAHQVSGLASSTPPRLVYYGSDHYLLPASNTSGSHAPVVRNFQGARIRRPTSDPWAMGNSASFVTVPVRSADVVYDPYSGFSESNDDWVCSSRYFGEGVDVQLLNILWMVDFSADATDERARRVQFQVLSSSGGSVVQTEECHYGENDTVGTFRYVRSGSCQLECSSGQAIRMQVVQNSGDTLDVAYTWSVEVAGGKFT